MSTSRFSDNGFAANGNGHAESREGVRVAAPEQQQGSGGAEEQGSKTAEGAASPRTLDDSRAGLGKEGRDERGRFTKNCKGGPGNPYNRQVARLKRELLDAVTPEDVREIGKRLVAEAREGNVAAARVLFMYVLPKNVEPDRMDIDEWNGYREEVKIYPELMPVLQAPESDFMVSMVRDMRPAMTDAKIDIMGRVLKAGTLDVLNTPAEAVRVAPGSAKHGKKGSGKRRKRRRGRRG